MTKQPFNKNARVQCELKELIDSWKAEKEYCVTEAKIAGSSFAQYDYLTRATIYKKCIKELKQVKKLIGKL